MSTWPLALMLAIAAGGCRVKPPEPLHTEDELEPDPPVGTIQRPPAPVLAARPDIDVAGLIPDPTHELRWPLTIARHPELEPQFAIASALAEPGVGLIDLCRLGAHNRHLGKDKRDYVTYLRGWCSVGKQDYDGAIASLQPLTTSVVAGIAPAVRADFANILVSSGDANDASRLLSKHKITDLAVLDTLAATYVEIGKLDDAYLINELALAIDDRRSPANRCRRLTRRIVLRPPAKHVKAIDVPNASLFDISGHETCDLLSHELECWLDPVNGCKDYFTDQNVDPVKTSALAAAYYAWPNGTEGSWWQIANNAMLAIPHPGADLLAVTALTNGVRSTRCDSPRVLRYVELAKELQAAAHSPALDVEITGVIDGSKMLCAPVEDGR